MCVCDERESVYRLNVDRDYSTNKSYTVEDVFNRIHHQIEHSA